MTDAYPIDWILEVMSQEILFGSAPLVPLIAIAMLLTTAGIYGVLAFAITRRSREFAVRMAVGATAPDLIRLVTSHALRLVATGSTAGIAATYALARVVRAGGGAGSVFDPETAAFVVPLMIVIGIGTLAMWIPSRALKIDPAILLRDI